MNDKITNVEISEFLKDHLERSEIVLLEEGKEMDDILSVAKAKGYILKGSNDLAGFKTIFTFANKANINKARLPKELLLKALPGIIGKPVDIDHNRIYVVGHYIDYRYIAAKDMVIAYGVFYKSNFGDEWARAKQLFAQGKLGTSYEIWCSKSKRKYLADGTYMLMSIEIAGGGLMFKEKPAFPDALVEGLENASVHDFMDNVKKCIVEHQEDLVFASAKKNYDPAEIITSGTAVVDTKMMTADELIGKPVSTALPAGDKVYVAEKVSQEATKPVDLVKLAQDNALKNTGAQPAQLNNDKLGDNVAQPGPQITAMVKCGNCQADFTPSAQTFVRKNSIDFNEVAADSQHKCPGCKAIINRADGVVKCPPQVIDFNLSCPNCSSRNWKITENTPETAKMDCMQCFKHYDVQFQKAMVDPLRSKLNFMSEGSSSCPQCGNRIAYSTSSNVDTKNVVCPKCELHYAINVKKSENKRIIARANEYVQQEENMKVGPGGEGESTKPIGASIETPEVAGKDMTNKNQPVKIVPNQRITDVMAKQEVDNKVDKNLETKPNEQVNNSSVGVLYLVRHGKTALNGEKNDADRIRGWKNVPLDKEGKLEANELGQIFKGKKIDKLYSSDLSRAYDTATEIAKGTGTGVTSKFDLRPWNLGKYQGESSSKAHPAMLDAMKKTPHIKVEGGESFNNFKTRCLNVARKLIEEAKQKQVVAVTHTRDVKLIQAWIAAGCPADNSFDEKVFLNEPIKTGSIHKIEPTDKGVKITEVENLQKASILDNGTTESSVEGGENSMSIKPEQKIETPAAEVTPVVAPVVETQPVVEDENPIGEKDEAVEVEDAEAVEQEEVLEVAKTLKAEDRNALSNQKFAVVKTVKDKKTGGTRTVRKYPIHDAAHVRNALSRLHQGPSREGLQKLGVNPDAVITKVKAAGKKFGIETAEMEGYAVSSKDRSMQPTTKRGKDDVQELPAKDQNNYVGASINEQQIAKKNKKEKTGTDAVEGLTPDQVNQMQNQLFANTNKALKYRKAHKLVMKNIKSLKKAMQDGVFCSVQEIDVTENMGITGKKSTTVSDDATKPTEAVTTGTKPVPAADCIEVNNDADAAAKALAAKLIPEKQGGFVDPVVAPAAPVENAEVPGKGATTTDTVSDGVATPKEVSPIATEKPVNLDQNAEAEALAKKLIPETPGEALKPGSELKPITAPAAEVVNVDVPAKGTETPVSTVSDAKVTEAKGTGADIKVVTAPVEVVATDTEILKSSVEALQKEIQAQKEKIQLLETSAVKLIERKNALGEFGKDLTDKDILDDAKFEVAKLKAENAQLKKELNTASCHIAEVGQMDGETLKSLKAEINAKAQLKLNKK